MNQGTLDKCHRLQRTIKQQVVNSVNRIWVHSFIKDQISEEQTWRETGREDGKLQPEELAVLLQRLEKMELQHRKELEEWKTLKQIQEIRRMLEQNKEMDKSQQHMEHIQRVVEAGEATEDTYDEMCDIEKSTEKEERTSVKEFTNIMEIQR